jgi:hypothetical protein
MNQRRMSPAARRTTLQIVLLVLASGFSASCKTLWTDSDLRLSEDRNETDKLLPEYTPQFLKIDAGIPGYAKSDPEVTKVILPQEGVLELSLAKAKNLTSDEARYFFSLYAWQGVGPLNLPSNTHIFGVFLRVDGRNIAFDPIQYFTISWDAADGVTGVNLPSKHGHNYSLQETYGLRKNLDINTEVRRSRVVEITPALFAAAYAHYTRLSIGERTGIFSYKLLDDLDGRQRIRRFLPGGYSNCQHAVADILSRTDGTLLETGLARGYSAADITYKWLSPHFVSTDPGLEVIAQRMLLQKPSN